MMHPPPAPSRRRLLATFGGLVGGFAGVGALDGCATGLHAESPHPTQFANIGYATWSDAEPPYRLYPGDTLDIAVPSAPELNRTVIVQPDGRIVMPLIAPVMAADRSLIELDGSLAQAYASQLLRPAVEVSVKQSAPLKIFVGGEVKNAGVYDMPGDINALQGVLLAGGFTIGARRQEVVVIRRGIDGRPMLRTVDLQGAIYSAGRRDAVPLRRFDIVYVPRTGLAELADFVTEIRNALPIQFSYVIGGQYASVG